MSTTIIPDKYKTALSLYETQTAIGFLKRRFEKHLCLALNLKRVSAPLFVDPNTGLNDDLNGVERPVRFDIRETGLDAVVVHSLAKWKRLALAKYGFPIGEGIYTDMNAIRRDEDMDNLHSIYVDQWDWEKVIDSSMRNTEYLKKTVSLIVNAVCDTLDDLKDEFINLKTKISRNVEFITTQELEDLYPELSPKQRENAITKKYKTVFISQIGVKLHSGSRHDGRAPDYDDWTLNGDIMFWNDVLDSAMEISSMGIRVDSKSLDKQLSEADCDERRKYLFHKMLLNGELPLTMGGGIGQSRLSMLLLQKCHIGEVQVSLWDNNTLSKCAEKGIEIL
ncbi:MAG: aspartate--ammonia ligase [Clostridia bacterium]